MYADTKGKMLELAVEKLIGDIRVLVQHWAGDGAIYGKREEMTHFMEVSSTIEIYLFVDGKNSESTFSLSRELPGTEIIAGYI